MPRLPSSRPGWWQPSYADLEFGFLFRIVIQVREEVKFAGQWNRRKGKRQRSNQSVAVYFKIFLDCLFHNRDYSLHGLTKTNNNNENLLRNLNRFPELDGSRVSHERLAIIVMAIDVFMHWKNGGVLLKLKQMKSR